MHGTTSSIGTPGRFPGAAARTPAADVEPAWRPWLRLFDLALEAAEDAAWERAAALVDVTRRSPVVGVPLLDGCTLRVDARRARRLVRDLVRTASAGEEDAAQSLSKLRSRRFDSLELIRAAIAQDAVGIERIAATTDGVDASALGVVAQLAAIPLLRACAVELASHVPESWMSGYCPVCGAWPTLAELRGLERNRRLRCGRCSADWAIPVLQCPYCNELRHDRLRGLLPEGQEQTRRVDTCETCKGYLKACSTLQPMALRALATTDLATLELDMVAQERGYVRPSRPGYAIAVRVESASGRRAPGSSTAAHSTVRDRE